MYVILVYDIKSDEGGQKVLSKTFKTCKNIYHIFKTQFLKVSYQIRKLLSYNMN